MTILSRLNWYALSALCLAAAPVLAEVEAGAIPRIALLHVTANLGTRTMLERLRQLRTSDGRSYVVEDWYAQDRPEELPKMAVELVKSRVNVIVAFTNLSAFAAKDATRKIPIVVFGAHDAVGTGLVSSLARPGGNITGTESLAPELDAKRLQLFTQLVPNMKQLAVIYNPEDQGSAIHLKWAHQAGQTLGFQISRLEVRTAADFEIVLRDAAVKRPDGLLMLTSELTGRNWKPIIEYGQKNLVATMCEYAWYVDRGCLISYGPDFTEFMERVVQQVDRILKGANPAEIPFEQPTRLELVVNKKTALVLGMTIPPSIQMQVTRTAD